MAHPDHGTESAALLREYLAERDVPCPRCAYNLRGCQATRCPECGAALDLRVGSTDVRLWPWLIALLGAALPLGFFATISAIILVVILVYGDAPPPGERGWVVAVFLLTATYLGTVAMLVRNRRKFMRRRRPVQTWGGLIMGAVFILGSAGFLIAFFRYMA